MVNEKVKADALFSRNCRAQSKNAFFCVSERAKQVGIVGSGGGGGSGCGRGGGGGNLFILMCLEKIEQCQINKSTKTMNQCTAFTKAHARCKKKASNNTVCKYHESYYDDWLSTHPPPNGWRLNIEEKEEYKFQIENGHVTITNEYVQSFEEPEQSDYYEYLLHLPQITCESNIRMLIYLIKSYLDQYSCITLSDQNLQYFFGNFFRNPHFSPLVFAARIIYVLDHESTRTEARIREIFTVLLESKEFAGMFYMNWIEKLAKKLPRSTHLPIFKEILEEKKANWCATLKKNRTNQNKEIEEVALMPERVVDWYLDWEMKHRLKPFIFP